MKTSKPKKTFRYFSPLEKEAILERLKKNGGNVLQTAKDSGISRNTLISWTAKDEHAAKYEPKIISNNTGKKYKPKEVKVIESLTPAQIEEATKDVADHITMTKLVRDAALKRLLAVVSKEDNIDYLTKLVGTLTKNLEPVEAQQPITNNQNTLNVAIEKIENNYHGSDDQLKKVMEQMKENNLI